MVRRRGETLSMQVQPRPLRAKEAYLTRTALEKVLTRHFFHIHSHSFFPPLLPLLPLLLLPHLPIPDFKVLFMQKLVEFSCPRSLLPGGTCSLLEHTVSTISF